MPQAQQLGRYLLLDRIAFGGMAEIFRGKTFDEEGRVHLVAVKRVLSHLVEDEDFLQMLVDEAKISALLRHENIARLYEFARAGSEYFLAMEYVDGKDARSLIEKAKQTGVPIPAEHAAWIAKETARALHAAHIQRDAAGEFLRIVHRDVSPSNVLCSYGGEVKLCDFGIAKATLNRLQTKTGVIKGKVKYMSPEQAMGRKLDHRSDLFSLGTVLYEMLTLQPPFQAPTEIELIMRVRDARRRAVTDYRRDLPKTLVAIIDKAMTRSRAQRFQSGEEMALALQRFLDEQRPGYRRAHFARHMQATFAEEIARDQAALAAFAVDDEEVDETRVGENLIADVLEEDAPFTRFSPLLGGGTRGGPTRRRGEDEPSELHAQGTMLLRREQVGLQPNAHETAQGSESSMDGDPFEELETRLRAESRGVSPARRATRAPSPQPQPTQAPQRPQPQQAQAPQRPQPQPQPEPALAELQAEPTRLHAEGAPQPPLPDLHAEPTRLHAPMPMPSPTDLHAEPTRLHGTPLAPLPELQALETRILSTASPMDLPGLPPLAELRTRLKSVADAAPRPASTGEPPTGSALILSPEDMELVDDEEGEAEATPPDGPLGPLHEESTVIFDLAMPETRPFTRERTRSSARRPAPAEPAAERTDEHTDPEVPLDDADLEEDVE